MADAALLEARSICVSLGGHAALRDVTFRLESGTPSVILGANGAGKSSLLRALHGLLPLESGSILWNGKPGRPREQAMVFQRPVMLRRPALGNVEFALSVAGVAGEERARRAAAMLAQAGISHLAGRQARVLSVGEQQRLALARAWSLMPRVLFLDEPSASLDPPAAAEVERLIGEIAAAGVKMIMTTHNLGLAHRVAGEILFLHQGRLAEQASPRRFFHAPASPEAAAFLRGELP
jgi:tungstate transport system ATP-binding protein